MKGTYLLFMNLEKNLKIKIGKLGIFNFPKGTYVYAGSALNSLEARIKRHLSKKKKMHWHIDYFLKKAKIIDVTKIPSNKKTECKIANKIKGKIIANKFGSTDCKCRSHLFFIDGSF